MTKTIEQQHLKLNIRSRSASRERPAVQPPQLQPQPQPQPLQQQPLIRTNSNLKLADDLNNPSASCSTTSSTSSSSSYTDTSAAIDANNNVPIYPKLTQTQKDQEVFQELRRMNTTSIKYGELVVLGYNGTINNSSNVRRKSKYVLKRRDLPNGVKPTSQHVLQSTQEADNLILKNPNHSVTYTLSRNQTVVVQYTSDEKTDMFQIGRSSEPAIDFIVLDTQVPTVTASGLKILNQNQQSTISRFSCRIVVDREYPYTARIYAAGFDASKRIFLGEKATKWTNEKGEMDGVTTNGVLIMHPTSGFIGIDSKSNEWMEVSVCGAVFSLSETRLAPMLSKAVQSNNPNKNNILRDGTLIDLCGATMLWRSIEGLQRTPTKHYIDMNLEYLNRLRPQCPVGLKTLIFPSDSSTTSLDLSTSTTSLNSTDRIPMVYLKCGHVHGNHDWGIKKDNDRECPLCRKVGPYVQLIMGAESSFYTDTDMTNSNLFKPYAFRPCGHMASEKTCKYWSRIMVPQGTTQGLNSICPFCAVTLCKEQPYVKLIFQEGV